MLTPELIDMMNTQADVVVGSRGADLLPSMCWGMGGRVSADGRRVTLWVHREQGQTLLADVRASRMVAATFSSPFSSRSLQVKGHDAVTRDAVAADSALLAEHLDNMVREIGRVGFSEAFVRTAFGADVVDLVAIEFTPAELFEQTPGPRAGQALRAGA